MKEPYEQKQTNFEYFFSSYYVIMSYFLETERQEHMTNCVTKSIELHKSEVIQMIQEGIQNPVIASALHQHSEDYIMIFTFILHSTAIAKTLNPQTQMGEETTKLVQNINCCLIIQIENMFALLKDNQHSSLETVKFNEMEDLVPYYNKSLTLFECLNLDSPQVEAFKTFVNGDTHLRKED